MPRISLYHHVGTRFVAHFMLFVVALYALHTHAAPPKTIELQLKKGETIKLDAIDVKAEFEEEEIRDLRKLFLYNIKHHDLIDLYSYIVRIPNVLDGVTYNGVYNLNMRGINSSPLNHFLPFDIVIDGISFVDAYRAPHHVYMLPRVNFFSGVDAFNELSSGSQGVVSVTTSQPTKYHKRAAVAEVDMLTQRVYGYVAGPIKGTGYYGLHLNGFNRPGLYKNKFLATQVDVNNDTRIDETFDDENSKYANGYIIFALSPELEARLYTIYNDQTRGFVNGYQTTHDNFGLDYLSPGEYNNLTGKSNLLATTAASADIVGSFVQSKNAALGLDGSYYLRENIFEFGVNAQSDTTTKILHTGNSVHNVPNIAATYQENEQMVTNRFEITARFKPISVEYATYRFGFNLRLEDKKTNYANTTILADTSSLGRSNIVLDYNHDNQTSYAQVYGDYNFEFGALRIDAGGLFIGYQSNLTQRGGISENKAQDTAIGLLEGINNRLAALGLDTRYTAGNITGTTKFTSQALLPKATLEWQTFPSDYQINYFAKYYQGYIPGGINPYAISDVGRSFNEYDAQINTTTEVGLVFFSQAVLTRLSLFAIDMKDVHYLNSLNGLEKYYGNAERAHSNGAELFVNYVPAINWNFDFVATALNAKYQKFVHTAYSNGSQSVILDYADNVIPLSPAFTARMSASYISYFGLYTTIEVIQVGEHFFDNANKLKSDGYALLNAELGWENDQWAVELYGKNLTNKEYTKNAVPSPYNSAGTALAQNVTDGNNGTAFRWENTVIHSIGQPLTVGLLISARY